MVPEHTGVLPLTLPPAVAGVTVTVVVDELASGHVPLCTTALNWVVCVSAPDVYVVAVLVMLVQVVNGATELSHLTTLPVLPVKVNVPLVDPAQMLVPPLTLPPAEAGSTITTTESALRRLHKPF